MARGPYFTYRPGGIGDRIFGGDPLATLQRELNRVFDELDIPTRGGEGSPSTGKLVLDVSETAAAVKVCVELPGVAEDDVEVTLNDDVLTISGERRGERRETRETVHTSERATGAFQRSVKLPSPVDPDAVSADFSRGVLTVTLPKPQAGGKGRKIQVRSGSAAAADSGSVDAATAGGATGGTPMSGSVTGGAGGSVEGAGGFGFIQGDGAQGASPSTGVGDAPSDVEPPVDVENATRPGGAVHGYNE